MQPFILVDVPPVWWQVVSDAAIAVGTISVAVLAIWGSWFRSKLAGARLHIELTNRRGIVVRQNNGLRRIQYHLRVRNARKWSPGASCRIMLRRFDQRGPDGQFHPAALSVPLQFVWAPSGVTPTLPTIADEQVLDFGSIVEHEEDQCFTPALYVFTNDFDGVVRPAESVRYHLQPVCDDFVAQKWTVLEVSWDGVWTDNLDQMENHLRIRVI